MGPSHHGGYDAGSHHRVRQAGYGEGSTDRRRRPARLHSLLATAPDRLLRTDRANEEDHVFLPPEVAVSSNQAWCWGTRETRIEGGSGHRASISGRTQQADKRPHPHPEQTNQPLSQYAERLNSLKASHRLPAAAGPSVDRMVEFADSDVSRLVRSDERPGWTYAMPKSVSVPGRLPCHG